MGCCARKSKMNKFTQTESQNDESKYKHEDITSKLQIVSNIDFKYIKFITNAKEYLKNDFEGVIKYKNDDDYYECLMKENIVKKNSKSLIKNIKSIQIFKKIFNIISKKIFFQVIKYNKNIQNKLNIYSEDYKELCEIEIEIKPKLNEFGKFINIKKEDRLYYHIFFNNNQKEINRTYLNKNENVANIKIIIDYQIESFDSLFEDCKCIESISFTKFNSNNIKQMNYMFNNCSSLKVLNLINFNTDNVTSMTKMFDDCSSLKRLNLSSFNTDKVEYMNGMFSCCSSLKKLDLSNFNTINVRDMSLMFYGCSSLKLLNISNFITINLNFMTSMFSGCSSLKEINIPLFNTKKVSYMCSVFCGCSSLIKVDISSFNTNKVIEMDNLFCGCSSLKEINLSNFNTEKVTKMNEMFYGCSSLENIDISNFNTDNVKDMSSMFLYCSNELIKKIKEKYKNIRDEAFK